MQILIIDIETRPNLAYVWGIWDQNIPVVALLEHSEVISFAAKWLGDDEVHFKSVFHDGKADMLDAAWNFLDSADAVMHYNGKQFDIPHLQREMAQADIPPPAPYKQIDLLLTVRRQFKFPSNKLEHVSKAFGLEGKVEHEGYPLWIKCLNGDADAWTRMREYNIQDVVLLEELYEKILPWIERHPSYGAHGSEDVCPNCGSEDLQSRGYAVTRTGKYPRFQCQGCAKWSRGTHRVDKTAITEVAGS